MAIAVTANLTEISDCDQTTGWSTGALNDAFMLEGTQCLGLKVSETTSAVITYDFGSGTEANMTDKFIIMTMMVTGYVDTKALGGYRIYAEDSAGNNGTWYVGGNDTHPGGWGYFAVDPSTTYTSGTGTIDVSAIRYVGIQFKVISKALGNASNSFWDICHYGTGLTMTSAATDAASYADFYSADNTGKYGIIQYVNGVYFIQGLLTLDDGSTGIDFTPDGEWAVWKENEFVPDSFHGMVVNGYAAGTVNIEMANCQIKGDGTNNPTFNFSNANIDTGTINGTTFVNLAASTFTGMGTLAGMAFDTCAQVTTGSITFNTSVFRNSVDTGGAYLHPPDDTNIKTLTFVNCDNGVEYDATSDSTTPSLRTFTFDDVSGNYDINNTSGSSVTLDIVDGGNANSYNPGGSTVTFNNYVYHELTNLINNTEVSYMKLGTAEDSGTAGSTVADSRTFTDSTKTWTTNQFMGRIFKITSGSDIGRYYVVSNTVTTIKLDTEMTTTGSSIAYSIYDENDMTSEFHVEDVTGNSTNYGYNYASDFDVDIIIHHVNYEQYVLLDVTLGDSDQSIPITQIAERVYFNPA